MANKYNPATYSAGGAARKPAGQMTPFSTAAGVAGAHAYTPEMFVPQDARKPILDKTNPYGTTQGGKFQYAKDNPYSRQAIAAANTAATTAAEPAASWKGSQEWADANKAVRGAQQTVWNNDQNGPSAKNFDQARYEAALTALEEARAARKTAKSDFKSAASAAATPAEVQEFDRARAQQWKANQQKKAEKWDARQAKAQSRYDAAYATAEEEAAAAAAAKDQENKQFRVNTDRAQRTTDPQGRVDLRNTTRVKDNTLDLDFSRDRRRVENALLRRLNPQLDRDREAQNASLLNAGIGIGNQAYSAAQDDMNRAALDARIGAILSAGQEQSRMQGDARAQAAHNLAVQQQAFGQRVTRDQSQLAREQQAFGQRVTSRQDQRSAAGQAYNQAQASHQQLQADRAAALQEQLALRNQQINEVTALMAGGQVQSPNFAVNTPGALPTVDQAGLINNAYGQEYAAWQQKQQQRQQLFGGLLGFGAGLLGPGGI